MERGAYILNPGMLIRFLDSWMPVKDIIDSQGASLNEMMEHSADKHMKEMEEMKRKWEKEKIKRDREEEQRRYAYWRARGQGPDDR